MTVAVFIDNESNARSLIRWGVEFAAADHTNLLVVVPRRSKGKQAWNPLDHRDENNSPLIRHIFSVLKDEDPDRLVLKQDIAEGIASSDHDRVAVDPQEILSPDPVEAFSEKVNAFDVTLLVLPSHEPVVGKSNPDSWQQRLFVNAPCEVVIVRGHPPENKGPIEIVLATENEDDPDTRSALNRTRQLASRHSGTVTLMFVRPDDDVVATDIAQRHLARLERQLPGGQFRLNTKTVLAENLAEGIRQLDLSEVELVVVGTSKRRSLANLFRQGNLLDGMETSLVAFRHAVPVADRLWIRFRNAVRERVPQINREYRISLVDRLQISSNFDFDFLALISLSTLIAALGLVRDSGAVVIGAMLVAPLMTPLVAIGFSLVQGNEKLIRISIKSVLLGFTVALGIGFFIGALLHLFAPDVTVTGQMAARSYPNLLDLIVALASGVAGAYAMGRPNLISAIPGVAIAAALVPPIATSGLSLAMGAWNLFGGSLLLFATNIVAIVLGTGITFWAVGIDNRIGKSGSGGSRNQLMWPRYWFLALVALSFFLAAEMTFYNPVNSSSENEVDRIQVQLEQLQEELKQFRSSAQPQVD